MMSREAFKEYMNKLIAFDDYLSNLSDMNVGIFENVNVEGILRGYVTLLERILDLTLNEFGESDISFYLWECDKGRAENAWIEYLGEKHYIRNLDELYDWIIFIKEHCN